MVEPYQQLAILASLVRDAKHLTCLFREVQRALHGKCVVLGLHATDDSPTIVQTSLT